MLIAEEYLKLASPAQGEVTETLGMTKESFMPGAAVTENIRELTIVGAHLSSAAIRLASIEDVLRESGNAAPSYSECRAYYGGAERLGEKQLDDDPRGQGCSEWFHVMLRDNAAHKEPPRDHADTRTQRRRQQRQ